MVLGNILASSPKSYQIPPYLLLAILLGLSMPARFIGQGLQGLFVFLVFLMLLTPALRHDAVRALRDLWAEPRAKMLGLLLVLLLPSVFFSVAPIISLRTWSISVVVLLFCAGLSCFKYASEADKKMAIQILVVCLFVGLVFVLWAFNYSPETLHKFWSFRENAGLTSVKSPHYDYFITPKLLVNGFFILIPLLLYWGIFYFTTWQWRFLSFGSVVSLFMLTQQTGNRAVMAGIMLMLLVGAGAVLLSKGFTERVNIRFGRYIFLASFLLAGLAMIVGYSIYFSPEDYRLFWSFAHNATMIADKVEIDYLSSEPMQFPSFLPYGIIEVIRQIFLFEAVQVWQQNPFWGIGINATDAHEALQNKVGSYFANPSAAEAMTYVHNRFVEILLETGLIGFVPFIIFLFMVLQKNLMRFIRDNHVPSLLMLLVHTGYWGAGLFQFSVWEAWIMMIYIFTLIFITLSDNVVADNVVTDDTVVNGARP